MSWIITRLDTGEVRELFDKKHADKYAADPGHYEVLTAMEHLTRLNKEIAEQGEVMEQLQEVNHE